MLARNDRRALLWLLETSIWQASDLVRFGSYTEALSSIDKTVLLSRLHECEILIKKIREDDGYAIPTQRK